MAEAPLYANWRTAIAFGQAVGPVHLGVSIVAQIGAQIDGCVKPFSTDLVEKFRSSSHAGGVKFIWWGSLYRGDASHD